MTQDIRAQGGGSFTEAERLEIGAMLALREGVQGPLCRPVGSWLVASAQRLWPRLAGIAVWKRTNSRRAWVLVSYHHPARLCWSWSVRVAFFRNFNGRGWSRFWRSYRGNWSAIIPFVVEVGWHRQIYDWMLSSNAERKLEAVALYRPRREPELTAKEMAR